MLVWERVRYLDTGEGREGIIAEVNIGSSIKHIDIDSVEHAHTYNDLQIKKTKCSGWGVHIQLRWMIAQTRLYQFMCVCNWATLHCRHQHGKRRRNSFRFPRHAFSTINQPTNRQCIEVNGKRYSCARSTHTYEIQ